MDSFGKCFWKLFLFYRKKLLKPLKKYQFLFYLIALLSKDDIASLLRTMQWYDFKKCNWDSVFMISLTSYVCTDTWVQRNSWLTCWCFSETFLTSVFKYWHPHTFCYYFRRHLLYSEFIFRWHMHLQSFLNLTRKKHPLTCLSTSPFM